MYANGYAPGDVIKIVSTTDTRRAGPSRRHAHAAWLVRCTVALVLGLPSPASAKQADAASSAAATPGASAPDPDAPTIGANPPNVPYTPDTDETPASPSGTSTSANVTASTPSAPSVSNTGATPTPRPAATHPATALPHRPHWRPTGPPPEMLTLRGMPGAWFYRPSAGGRQRVLLYLHSRGANPREACMHWHESTPRFGWLVCPIGPYDRGVRGGREWRNNATYARRESIAAIEALAARFPRRVRRHDNVIMGFSEGAYTAMNVGLWEPLTFPRWFIIAAHDGYIDSESDRIRANANSVRRVYLLTGQHDEIVEHTRRANDVLTRAWGRRRVHMRILERASHELPPNFIHDTRRALLWVTAGP